MPSLVPLTPGTLTTSTKTAGTLTLTPKTPTVLTTNTKSAGTLP